MKRRKPVPAKDRRDIGQVVSPIEMMMAARASSSCCVGVEALLEADSPRVRDTVERRRSRN